MSCATLSYLPVLIRAFDCTFNTCMSCNSSFQTSTFTATVFDLDVITSSWRQKLTNVTSLQDNCSHNLLNSAAQFYNVFVHCFYCVLCSPSVLSQLYNKALIEWLTAYHNESEKESSNSVLTQTSVMINSGDTAAGSVNSVNVRWSVMLHVTSSLTH